VTDLDGNSVLSKGNMFGDVTSDGIDPATIEKSISVTLTTGDPMESGKTYHVKVTMWDAKSAMSYLESTVDLKMK